MMMIFIHGVLVKINVTKCFTKAEKKSVSIPFFHLQELAKQTNNILCVTDWGRTIYT